MEGLEALQNVLRRMRWDDQGGYSCYGGNGKWHFVSTGLPQTTPEELNALFKLAGIVPDKIVSIGSCKKCRHYAEHRGGHWGPCGPCKRPKMSNFQPITIRS